MDNLTCILKQKNNKDALNIPEILKKKFPLLFRMEKGGGYC